MTESGSAPVINCTPSLKESIYRLLAMELKCKTALENKK